MESVVMHGVKKLKEELTPWQIEKKIEKQLEDILKGQDWPFKTVSKEYFLDVAVPLVKTAQDIEHSTPEQLDKNAEMYMDRIDYTSIDMLQCVQKMELEALAQEAVNFGPQVDIMHPHIPDNIKLLQKLSEMGTFLLNENNSRAVEAMGIEYMQSGRLPTRVCDTSSRLYMSDVAVNMTKSAVGEHLLAFSQVYNRAPQILKYGMPAETGVGRVVDALFTDRGNERKRNEHVVHDLAKAQAKIDHIENFAVHNLKQEASRFLLSALAEEAVKQGNPDFTSSVFREWHAEKLQAVSEIEGLLKEMKDKEKAMMKDMTLTIKKDKDGIYSITVSKGNGETRTQNIAEGHTKEIERRRREQKREIKLTKITEKVMEETKSFRAIFHGEKERKLTPTLNQTVENEKKGYERSQKFGEIVFKRVQERKYNGTKRSRAEAEFHTAQFASKKIKTHTIGPRTEEKTIIGGEADILGASASIKAPDKEHIGTPVFKAEAHAVNADVNIADLVKTKMGIGASVSAGAQLSAEDIIKRAAGVMFDEMANGNSANLTRIIDEVSDIIAKIPPSANVDWGSITISVGDFDVFEAKVKQEGEMGQTHTFAVEASSPLYEDVKKDAAAIQAYVERQEAQEKFPFDNNPTPTFTPEPQYVPDMDYARRPDDHPQFDMEDLRVL